MGELKRVSSLVRNTKDDLFVPKKIRDEVVDMLENRFKVILDIYMSELKDYRNSLASGKFTSPEDLELNWIRLHNHVNDQFYAQGCGISQIEDSVKKIRREIKKHFESFNPIKR